MEQHEFKNFVFFVLIRMENGALVSINTVYEFEFVRDLLRKDPQTAKRDPIVFIGLVQEKVCALLML